MARYRTRAILVDAWQWFPGVTDIEGVMEDRAGRPVVRTRERTVPLLPGDWIVADPRGGSCYIVLSAEVFAATYEPAEG